MQKEQNYQKLFRARLPVASLPKEFADRLIKSVLEEVSTLRQARSLPPTQSDGHSDHSSQSSPPIQSKAQVADNHVVTTLFALLLINIHVGLLQGCTFRQLPGLWRASPGMVQTGSVGVPAGQVDWPSKTYHLAHDHWTMLPAVRPTQLFHAPPLPPLKPALPTVPGRQETLMIDGKPALISALSTVTGGQHTLPAASVTEQTVPITATMTVPQPLTAPLTLPQEEVLAKESASQATEVEPTPTLENVLPPQPATPTSNAPLIKTTATPTPSAPQAPVFSVFEPTMTPTTVVEGQLSTLGEEPIATATVSIQPWHTPTSEIMATLSTEEAAATTTATEAVPEPSPSTPTP